MNTIIPYLIIANSLGLTLAVITLLSQVSIWQRKEYRLDRLKAALFDHEFQAGLTTYLASFFCVLLASSALSINKTSSNFIALLSLLIVLIFYLDRSFVFGLWRPLFTKHALLIIFLSVSLSIALFACLPPSLPVFLPWSLLVILLPAFVGLSNSVVNVLLLPIKRRTINQARKLRDSLKDITVIGITGSYGKTSVKHILSQIIPEATVSHHRRNSEFTIAQDMLKQLRPDTKIYIAEMGAYKKGEVSALASLVQPTIGALTAIGNQHLALFGHQNQLTQTKWELINHLPQSGTAVLNADDPRQVRLSQTTKKNTIWFSAQKETDVYANNVAVTTKSISFTVHHKNESRHLELPLVGRSSIYPILCSIAVSLSLGLSLKDITSRLNNNVSAFERTMKIVNLRGATIIDDSYSANEAGVLSAITHLSLFNQADKRIIMVPLIELGQASAKVHQKIGSALAKSQAQVYIYGRRHAKDILSGLSDPRSAQNIHFVKNPKKLAYLASQNISSDTVILIEGRVPDIVRTSILKNNPQRHV